MRPLSVLTKTAAVVSGADGKHSGWYQALQHLWKSAGMLPGRLKVICSQML